MAMDDIIRSGMDDLGFDGDGYPDDDFLAPADTDDGENDFSDSASDFDFEESGDSGISFDGADGAESFDGTREDGGEPDGKRSIIKRSVIGLAFLAVAIVIVVFCIRWFGHIGKDKPSDPTVPVSDVQNPNSGPEATPEIPPQNLGTQEQTQPATETPAARPQSSTVSEGWIWVDADPQLKFSQPIEGVFTVTNIKYVSKVVEAKKTLQLKSILTGSIDGVYGTYEVDVPYEKTVGLEVGTRLYITYVLAEKNGVQYVSGIDF